MDLFAQLSTISSNLFFGVLAILGIGFLIGFHEMGHFLFCKLFRISTPSFSIGFGPKLISRKIGETEFAISAIPLGGYVEIAGSAEVGQGEQKEANRSDEFSFAHKPYYQKLLVMLGGILFNLLFAYMAIVGLFMAGLPPSPFFVSPVIQEVKVDSPAAKAGLMAGDRITAINSSPIEGDKLTIENRRQLLQPNKEVTISIDRNGTPLDFTVLLGAREVAGKTIGYLGAEDFATKELAPQSLAESLKNGIALTNKLITETVKGFASVIKKRDTTGLASPIKIISMTMQGAAQGLKVFLLFMAIISVSLAVLNLFPLPILDGGQILFYTIEAIIGRELPFKVKNAIHITSWLLIMALTLYLIGRELIPTMSQWIATLINTVSGK